MNKTMFIGNLTKDPELRTTQSGRSVCSFSVAVNDGKNPQTGEQYVTYYRVSAWDKQAENCAKFLVRGRKVYVEGRPSASAYTKQDGTVAANLEVTAHVVEFLSSIADPANQPAPAPAAHAQVDAQTGFAQVDTNDLPF